MPTLMKKSKDFNKFPKKEQLTKEMNMWELQKLINRLPEAELKQVYYLVDELLHGKYGARMHQ